MSRTKVELVSCDTCGADKAKRLGVGVVFTTEQTEGHPSDPYFEWHDIDLCDDCFAVAIKGKQIFAYGAQGYNKYFFKKDLNDKSAATESEEK